MQAIQFCYWLRGYEELSRTGSRRKKLVPTKEQIFVIGRHLTIVRKFETNQDQTKNKCYAFCAWLGAELVLKNGKINWDEVWVRLRELFVDVSGKIKILRFPLPPTDKKKPKTKTSRTNELSRSFRQRTTLLC
jgi:hypothetical protein